MAAGSVPGLNTQPGQPAGTRVGIQAMPETSARPRVIVPTIDSRGTQPPARQCVVARPLDRQGVATNSPSPQPVST